jgi:hypothetical protein
VLTVFLLTSLGVIGVKEYEDVEILDSSFIPYVWGGILTVREFQLCEAIDPIDKRCINPVTVMKKPGTVALRLIVETSPVNGQVFLLENYVVRDGKGYPILTAESDLPFESETDEELQYILFTDFFVLNEDILPGSYTIDVIVKNPLLNKEVTITRRLTVQ